MADKVRRKKNPAKSIVFDMIRKMIAQELQRPDLQVRAASQLELAISTFAPSTLVKGFRVTDYPFIGARYMSVEDGHAYIVAGTTDDGLQVMAYRLGFLRSMVTTRGGIAVGITAEAWMRSKMNMYSLHHASMQMIDGTVENINSELTTRRTFPGQKWAAYREYLKRHRFHRILSLFGKK